jgi:hypothetical protein
MAKKKTGTGKKRIRRSPEQLIADLQAKIKDIENRAAAKEIKRSPSAKAALAAVRHIDKANALAEEEGNTALRRALADGRKPLAAFLEAQGMQLPKARAPRGRRPKSE